MTIQSLSKLTRTYVLTLSLIAALTFAIFITLHQVILTQTDSARLVNLSGSQRWLSQKTALLSVELVHSTTPEERHLFKNDLSLTIEQIENNNQQLVKGSLNKPQLLSPQMKSISVFENSKGYHSQYCQRWRFFISPQKSSPFVNWRYTEI